MMILERREGAWAILETEEGQIRVEASQIPADAPDGAVLTEEGGRYAYDREATQARLEKIRQRMRRLAKKS